MLRVIIFAAGKYGKKEYYRNIITSDDFLLCADGGANFAYSLGLVPNLVLGDFDSIAPDVQKLLENEGCPFVKYPAEKDESDLELALEHALRIKPEEIIIFGALGGRIDHALANIFLLETAVPPELSFSLRDEGLAIYLFNESLVLEGNKGDILSLLPLSEKAENVRTEGLSYPLKGEVLYRNQTRGLSNIFVSEKVMITISAGKIIAIHSFEQKDL